MKEIRGEKILKALANRRRLAIIYALSIKKEMPVNALAKQISLSFRSTSKHLSILYAADMVDRNQRSTLVYYRLNQNGFRILPLLTSIS